MAEANSATGAGQDEGVGHLQAFVALLGDTRALLAERQATLEARSDALAEQAASSASRLQSFQETVTGMAESFATVSHTAAIDLGRLAQVASELGEELRGPAAESLQSSEGRFVAGTEASRLALEKAGSQLGEALGEIEQAVDRGDERTATLLADQDDGYTDLTASVAEADSTYAQGDFDLQGVLETTTTYLLEGLEQYLASVFAALFDHLENELPPYIVDLFQELGRSVHRALDDYDSTVEAVSGEMAAESEQALSQCARLLSEANDDRIDDRQRTFDEMRSLLEEAQRSGSVAGRGSEICSAYPPIVPQLAAAREVADRVQELMDVFNPFNS